MAKKLHNLNQTVAPSRCGRPPYKPAIDARCQVFLLTLLGFHQRDIAQALRVDRKTLRKHFRVELDLSAGARRAKMLSQPGENETFLT